MKRTITLAIAAFILTLAVSPKPASAACDIFLTLDRVARPACSTPPPPPPPPPPPKRTAFAPRTAMSGAVWTILSMLFE